MRARLEGAMSRRRLRGWNPPLENINALVASGGPRLLARSRELVVTNGYAANACEAFAANLVGDGIKPSSLIGDADLRDRVQRLWLAWTDEADADGLTDFYGLQAMVAREMFVAGECFVRLRPRRAEDGLPVPLQLQLLQSEMLPFEKTETAANGNRIRCGIEFDAIGRRVAYHFRRRHPGDSTDQGGPVIPETVRVPAADVLHVYRPIDAGQIRGLPHVAPAMVRLFLLDQYDDAELDRKKTAAMFAGFITKTAPEEPMMGEAEADPDGAAIASLEPGTMQVLLPGEDVRFSSPADVGGGYEAFQYRTLLAVSASLGLPYHLVTGDVRQANYSSLRAELVEFRRRVGQLQHGVLVIWASEVQSVRDFGSESATQQVQTEVAYRLRKLRQDAETTFEYHLLNGIQGIVKDPKDNATVVNYFTEFGISPAAEIDFDLDNASPASGALRKRCQALIEDVEASMGGLSAGAVQVRAECGSAFFADLVAHKEVRETYLNTAAAADLRGRVADEVSFGGITFRRYRGGVGFGVPTDKAFFFPEGIEGLFEIYYAPADTFETVNTLGLPLYARTIPDRDRDEWVRLEIESNPLPICTRPQVLRSARRT